MPHFALEDVIPLHLADVTFPEWHPLRGQAGDVFAFALRHRSGLILYETGIGRGNKLLDNSYQVVHRPIEAELEAHGHRVADVRLVVNSHLHFDHCGNNKRFPGVPIFVQAVEYEVARQPNYTVPEFLPKDPFPLAEGMPPSGVIHIVRADHCMSSIGRPAPPPARPSKPRRRRTTLSRLKRCVHQSGSTP